MGRIVNVVVKSERLSFVVTSWLWLVALSSAPGCDVASHRWYGPIQDGGGLARPTEHQLQVVCLHQ
jgi:hypothetical protein